MARASAPTRTILKGTLDFFAPDAGVAISVPVFVYKKSQDFKKVDAHLYHEKDQGAINYKKVCAECGEEVTIDEIVKMVETGNGLVPVENAEIKEVFNKTATSLKAFATISLDNILDGMHQNTLMLKD